VAHAVGPLLISAKLLRLIPVEVAESAMAVDTDLLTADEWAYLKSRCRPEETPRVEGVGESNDSLIHASTSVAAADDLYVKLFGRLEVVGPYGRVEDEHWSKRKSRRLFLMLVCRQGCDLSRDVILEYLWPDMDHDRALRNFYVTWSALKYAILSGERGEAWRRFLVCTGGVCRVTDAVHSDIAEFGRYSRAIRDANSSGRHADAVEAGELLIEVYRGDLLPADLYESWFEDDRTRFRREFCDSMLTAADSAYETGRYDAALNFLRRASAADPWREDVYQMIMRCQMTAGQRSGAIETYKTCRARLVDDLGIDPCAETNELFQAVLAMEGGDA
jgi:DNA-binding SARP family transcriptional activator